MPGRVEPAPTTRLPLPEPLRSFAGLSGALREALRAIDRLKRTAETPLENTREALRVELTYHSNALEGNTLTLADTALVIEGLAPASPGKTLREVYEARNHDRALRKLEEAIASGSTSVLTERGLLEVHGMILAEILPGSAGRFRHQRVRISGSRHVPPGSHRFEELLPALLRLADDPDAHPVLRAAELHDNLAAVHPFDDGNGRTARLMMNAVLLQAGYPLCILPVSLRSRYIDALETAHTGGDPAPFARLVLDAVRESLEQAQPES